MKKNLLIILIKCINFFSPHLLVFHLLCIMSLIFTSLNVKGEIIAREKELTQNKIIVTGLVTDSVGLALPGVTILEKGTTNGTISDNEGKYKINVSGNAILVFSFIGMKTVEIGVNNQAIINVTLTSGIQELDEVVIVGYGSLKSSHISSSITRVASSEIANRPVARVDQAIQGKIAGVQVQEVSGSPGRALDVRIRGGAGSITNSTSPLYVVDGFPTSGDLDNINPGDIESIEVLKDAASAAIYGSRGSNGVVLITTKSGTKGKSVIELDSYYGIQKRFSKVDVLNRDEYIQYAIEERTNSYNYIGGDLSIPEDQRQSAKYAIDPLWRSDPKSFPDNDWQDLISRVAPIQSHTLTASGGTDKVKYFISTNYFDQQGIIINSNYKRFSTRANVEISLNRILKVGLNLSYANSLRNDPNTDTSEGPINSSILVAPIAGINQQTMDGGYYKYVADFLTNPIAFAKETFNNTKNNKLQSNFYAEINLMKNLRIRSSFGANISTYNTDYYIDNNVYSNYGHGSVSNALSNNYLSETTITYDLLKNDWTLNLLGGFTYQTENSGSSFLEKYGFPDDFIKTLNAGTVLSNGTSSASKWSMISYLSRVNMSYRDKYLLTASIRRDGSSRFGKDNRWGVFPSASLGWIISKEPFMDKLKNQVSNLKLRGSYGIVGNNNIGDYSAIGLMDPANYVVGNTTVGGYIPSSFSNSSLSWEKTSTIDAGVDVGFIKNRINITFDYYMANTNDLLLYVPIPEVTGFGSALQNIGEVQNKGYEIELLTKNLVGSFKWSTSFNISHNRNEVKKLGPDGSPIIVTIYQSAKTITRIGDPIGSFYVFQTDGLFKNQADVEANRAMAYANVKPQPGDLKYKDQNGDGIIDEKDLVIGGNNRPSFIWGLTNSFQYKGFDLSFFMDGQAGNKLLNVANGQNIQSRGNVRGYWRDRWRSEEDPGNGKIPRACVTDNMTTYSDFMLFDAGFWRIRNISFGYQIPQKIANKILNIASIKLYGSVDNIFMKDHYNHMSETATFSNSTIAPGFDFDSGYPLARTYKLGINVKF